jgi:hypothetical protein
MPNSWVSQERIDHFAPLVREFAKDHPFPEQLNKFASGWKDHDWMTELSMNLEISVDYLRKILIGMGWITPKRKSKTPAVVIDKMPPLLIAEAGDSVLVLEKSRGGFKIVRTYSGDTGQLESNRLAAESFVAGYEFAMRNNPVLPRQGE